MAGVTGTAVEVVYASEPETLSSARFFYSIKKEGTPASFRLNTTKVACNLSFNFVAEGGLICYAANFPDLARRSATYAAKIFGGAKPADLPVEQPTRFELIVNLKTAKALGITVPQMLLAQADEVIE